MDNAGPSKSENKRSIFDLPELVQLAIYEKLDCDSFINMWRTGFYFQQFCEKWRLKGPSPTMSTKMSQRPPEIVWIENGCRRPGEPEREPVKFVYKRIRCY